jgi:hypothetical protein
VHDLPDFGAHFKGHMCRLLDALARSGKRGLTMGQLVDALYAHRADGGPDWPVQGVCTLMYQQRARLKSLGYNIERGTGERYRLVRLPAEWKVPPRQGNYARQCRAAAFHARWYAAAFVTAHTERGPLMEAA